MSCPCFWYLPHWLEVLNLVYSIFTYLGEEGLGPPGREQVSLDERKLSFPFQSFQAGLKLIRRGGLESSSLRCTLLAAD